MISSLTPPDPRSLNWRVVPELEEIVVLDWLWTGRDECRNLSNTGSWILSERGHFVALQSPSIVNSSITELEGVVRKNFSDLRWS